MGKHTLRRDPGATLRGSTTPPPSGNGWLIPEDVAAAQKIIDETNQKNVQDAAAEIHARRFHHGG
jgi:hypothetical protein